MRCAHVFPMFGKELINGSEHYELMLSRHLKELGMEIDVFTTRSDRLVARAPFSIAWPSHYAEGLEALDGMNVYRFASASLPLSVGVIFSLLILKRWRKEGILDAGPPDKAGKEDLYERYHRAASQRPRLYDYNSRLGRGPRSKQLIESLDEKARGYDIALVGFMPFSLPAQAIDVFKRHGKKVVLLPLFHPDDVYHHWNYIYSCFEKADAVLTLTDYSKRVLKNLLGGKVGRVEAVGAGVDAESFEDAKVSGERFRKKYGLGSKKVVLFVGRKESGKGYDTAIKAVERLNDPLIRLVMIGPDADKVPVREKFVLCLGKLPREELIDGYDACDVFVLPSRHESFGMVFLEAWMRKRPVVGNRGCGPVTSLIEDGVDGLLCEGVDDFSRAIRALLDDPLLAGKLGENGYNKALRDYTWSGVARRVANLYVELRRPG